MTHRGNIINRLEKLRRTQEVFIQLQNGVEGSSHYKKKERPGDLILTEASSGCGILQLCC